MPASVSYRRNFLLLISLTTQPTSSWSSSPATSIAITFYSLLITFATLICFNHRAVVMVGAAPPAGAASASGNVNSRQMNAPLFARPTSVTRRVYTGGYSSVAPGIDGYDGDDGDEYGGGGNAGPAFLSSEQREQRLMTLRAQIGQNASMYEWETLLLQYLFTDSSYNAEARPAVSRDKPVIVRLDMVLLKINELVEKDQEIVISGFLKINWTDVRLQWRPKDFGGIEWMITQAPNVWLPDIALINSNDVYAVTRDSRFPVTITSEGQVLFVPAGKIHARCELDLRFFPFDYQICYYRFESWVYSAESVTINGYNFTIDPNHYVQNHQWEIIDSFVLSKQVTYENFNFSRVDFYLLLRRKSLFFITYTIFPCLALSTLQIFSHMLPFTESERINFATTTLIAFSVFHVAIVEQMPQSSESIPLLAIYVDSLMILIGLSLIECFVMMNWLAKVHFTLPPPRLWWLVVERWGGYLWLGSAGTYWRRNYIRIYEHVNTRFKISDEERRMLRLHRNKRQGGSQEDLSAMEDGQQRNSFRFRSRRRASKAEMDILDKIARRWGYSSCIVENQHKRGSTNSNKAGGATEEKPLLTHATTDDVLTYNIPVLPSSLSRNQSPSSHQQNADDATARAVTEALNSGAMRARHHQQPMQQQKSVGSNSRHSAYNRNNNNNNNEEIEFSSMVTASPNITPYSSPIASERFEMAPSSSHGGDSQSHRREMSALKKSRSLQRGTAASAPQSPHYNTNLDPMQLDPLTLLDYMANVQPRMPPSSPSSRQSDRERMAALGVQSECSSLRHNRQLTDEISNSQQQSTRPHHHHHHHQHRFNDDVADSLPHRHHHHRNCHHRRRSREQQQPSDLPPTHTDEPSPDSIISHTTSTRRIIRLNSGGVAETSRCRPQDLPVAPGSAPPQRRRPTVTTNDDDPIRPSKKDTTLTTTDTLCSDMLHRQLAEELGGTVSQIHERIAEISSAVTSQELKRECIGIWTTFITIIDRIMSFLLLLLCCLMPTYLFLVFPEKLDISHLKADSDSFRSDIHHHDNKS